MVSLYKELAEEKRDLQERGLVPEWYTTFSWQMFKSKYQVAEEGEGVRPRFEIIAKTLSKHTDTPDKWEKKFFEIMWNGWFSPSTPMLANVGTTRGCSVACSGNYVGDSIDAFYEAQHEVALLSKNGFGTSSYLGDIRPRGSKITSGGKASGALPVIKDFVQLSRDVSQGNTRRGAWAGYLEITHDDFWEVITHLHKNPDDLNIGWIIEDKFVDGLESGNTEYLSRYKKALKVKAETGKGYFFFVDKANRANPPMYSHNQLEVKASQLCTEIMLYSDQDHTYTCVLGSMNAEKYDDWKDTDAVFIATVMLDCNCQEFIDQGRSIKGLEKAVRFTEKNRALGLGLLGFHSYLQANMIPFESLEAQFLNSNMFKQIKEQADQATKWMAEHYGEPENCKGFGVRNTHLLAVAPNMSTAILMGGLSQGIEPLIANVYNQGSAAGEIERINPKFMEIAKAKGKFSKELLSDIIDHYGSVQHLDWLTEEEKLVFKTAFEIDQRVIVRLASQRQKFICQGQSLNLFFSADEDEEYISEVHKMAFLDDNIKSLYYMRTQAGVQASKDACIACAD